MKKFKNKFSVISICALIFSLVLPSGANAAETNDVTIQSEVGAAVYGGTTASISEAPWQAAITMKSAPNAKAGFFCGGSLISNQWIITAAHCAVDEYDIPYSPSELLIHLGNRTLSSSVKAKYSVSSVRVHESYDSSNVLNDIALIKLTNPVTIATGTIEPIGLSALEASVGESVRVTGWGEVNGSIYPSGLQQGTLTIEDESVCSYLYGGFYGYSQICAGADSTDACSGDSGGPLTHNESGKHTLVGIVSYGPIPCADGNPGAYTRVVYFTDWLQSQMGDFAVTNSGVINTSTASTAKVTITSPTPRTVELLTNAGGTTLSIQSNIVLSWVPSSSRYEKTVSVQSTNPAFIGAVPGTYQLFATDVRTAETTETAISVSDGVHVTSQLTLDSSEYYPAVDGYKDVIEATLSLFGATGEAVPFLSGEATITVGSKTATCGYANVSSGVASCKLNLKGFSTSDETIVTATFLDGAGNPGSASSPIVALLSTEIVAASVSRDVGTVYPSDDGYRDTVRLSYDMTSSTGRSMPLTEGSLTVKFGSKTVQTWKITKSASSSKTWNGKKGGKVVPGTYTVILVAKGSQGRKFTETTSIVVSDKEIKTKTLTKSYSGRTAFGTNISYDDTACTYNSSNHLIGYTLYFGDAYCSSELSVPAAVVKGYDFGSVSVKASMSVYSNDGTHCGSFGIAEAAYEDKLLCDNGTKTFSMGGLERGSTSILTYIYLPDAFCMLSVKNLTLTYTYKTLG
jgi:secreted trypsin-like serine protease